MKCVGVKQVLKNLKENKVRIVYVAKDAEIDIIAPIVKLCEEKNIKIIYINTMSELGKMANIEVGASCTAE